MGILLWPPGVSQWWDREEQWKQWIPPDPGDRPGPWQAGTEESTLGLGRLGAGKGKQAISPWPVTSTSSLSPPAPLTFPHPLTFPSLCDRRQTEQRHVCLYLSSVSSLLLHAYVFLLMMEKQNIFNFILVIALNKLKRLFHLFSFSSGHLLVLSVCC